jgi:hypothetical protein
MQNEIKGIIYAFAKPEGTVFEVITNEGDNIYWAHNNGGIPLSPEDILQILQGKDANEVIYNIWNKML